MKNSEINESVQHQKEENVSTNRVRTSTSEEILISSIESSMSGQANQGLEDMVAKIKNKQRTWNSLKIIDQLRSQPITDANRPVVRRENAQSPHRPRPHRAATSGAETSDQTPDKASYRRRHRCGTCRPKAPSAWRPSP